MAREKGKSILEYNMLIFLSLYTDRKAVVESDLMQCNQGIENSLQRIT